MPSPVIPKPVFTFTVPTQMTEGIAYNKFYGVVTGVVGGYEDVLAITDAACQKFFPKWSACISSDCLIGPATGRYQSATMDVEAFATFAAANGEIEGDPLPIQDCFEIRKLTGKPGRDMIGRSFFSGLAELDQEYGKLKSERYAALNLFLGVQNSDLIIGDRTVSWRHWSRKQNILVPLSGGAVISRLVSRRDRAKKEKYVPIPAA